MSEFEQMSVVFCAILGVLFLSWILSKLFLPPVDMYLPPSLPMPKIKKFSCAYCGTLGNSTTCPQCGAPVKVAL